MMRTAERLYAEDGLASVSGRRIGEVAGQRNKSALQYHFTNRDGLIKAILARHITAMEPRRMAMVTALEDEPSLAEQVACLIEPIVEHQIELGTPSWSARFLAQILVEPAWREHLMVVQLDTPSVRRLVEIGHLNHRLSERGLAARSGAVIRQFVVHMLAELEYDLAHGRADPATAAASWRRLGAEMIGAVCDQGRSLVGNS
jgi:AcrR family transcriptional regulator